MYIALVAEITVVPSSRLLTLLSQSATWQQHQGLLSPDTPFNPFERKSITEATEKDAPALEKYATIKVNNDTFTCIVCFSQRHTHTWIVPKQKDICRMCYFLTQWSIFGDGICGWLYRSMELSHWQATQGFDLSKWRKFKHVDDDDDNNDIYIGIIL